VDVSTETPAATPAAAVTDAPVELSLDQIVAAELAAADAAGAAVVQEPPKAATETPPVEGAPAPDAPPVEGEPPPEADKPVDDVTARRVRAMLAKHEARDAELAAREATIAARETQGHESILADLLKNPKALLAKYGKSIDDVIDASIAEGKAPPVAEADDNPRLTALEKRIADRETAERQATVNAKIAEIQREITASPKYPLINQAKSASLVTDYMLEYHATHGKAISWDKAAAAVEADLTGMGIAAAKKLGWAPPDAKPAAAAVPPRADTPSIGGSARDAAPTTGDEPEDPEKLMKFLVAQAGLA
jgi:hypothetical protein